MTTLVHERTGMACEGVVRVAVVLRTSLMCYTRRMAEIASRELRNNTRSVLDRAAAGEDITITVDGRAVARLVPLEPRPRWIARDTLFARLRTAQADSALSDELDALIPDTTDDLDPL